jgi:hypothetical protein
MDLIDKELSQNIFVNTIVDQGAFNDYLFPKYFKYINNPETFDKIVNESLVKHGYKIIKIGSGNFITNPSRFKTSSTIVSTSDIQLFQYDAKHCPMCQSDMIPD